MSESSVRFLQAADAIGARLCRDALWAGKCCNWLGASMEPIGGAWKIVQRTFGPDVYGGASGIALFLARLHSLVDERIYRLTAMGALQQALARSEKIYPTVAASFYSGKLGIAYACITLGELFGEHTLVKQGLQLTEELGGLDTQDMGADVLSGRAGAIPALLNIYHRYPQQHLLDTAVQFADSLLQSALRKDIGWSWNTLNAPAGDLQPHLTGFSHGAAGIGWALLELYEVTHEPALREGAEQAFRYERHYYNPQQVNWPDFRDSTALGGTPGPSYMLAWCHGAPGIGLSRLRAYELEPSDVVRQEALAALQATTLMIEQSLAAGQGSYCLCHGLGGNAELLLYAAKVLDNISYRTLAEKVGDFGIAHYGANRSPWPCGVIGAGETPNLMLGLAGIGYFYLRLHAPDQMPSILILLPHVAEATHVPASPAAHPPQF